MKITFFGAAEGVTGAKYLVESSDTKILVDCGLFQGKREIRQRNWDDLLVNASSIDAIVLTHAHIDHIGYIPRLIKQGFSGPIYCSKGTQALSEILLPDSAMIQEEDAKFANKYNYSRHNPALPLYSLQDARAALTMFRFLIYDTEVNVGSCRIRLMQAGHIIGASFILLSDGSQTITFSGDLGRQEQLIMNAPASLQQTDYLVLESTYGDRLHMQEDLLQKLAEAVNKVVAQKGKLIIPSFAVGRAQMILYALYQLQKEGVIPKIPIFLDSPMAIKVTELYCQFKNEHKLSSGQCEDVFDIATYVRTTQESKALNNQVGPAIIIAGSGMLEGGRVLHHVKQCITDTKNMILFVGYQATGTKGRFLLDGADELTIHGNVYPVHASIQQIDGFSAHADASEILDWLSSLRQPPKKIFLIHGDMQALEALQQKIEQRYGWNVVIPKYQESFQL